MSKNFYTYNGAGGSRNLKSKVRLEELHKLTADLDKELEDSQLLLSDIKKIYNHVSSPNSGQLRPEQFARFLVADEPRLLMSDQLEPDEDDVEHILIELKKNAEYLKNNPESQQERSSQINKNVHLKLYVANLDRLCKSLTDINMDRLNSNKELDQSIIRLYKDVQNFIQMAKTITTLSDTDEESTSTESEEASVSNYNSLITDMIKSIDEVTYLFTHRD